MRPLHDCGPSLTLPGSRRGGPVEPREPGSRSGSVTPWAWRSSFSGEDSSILPPEFFLRETATVARELLGCRLRTAVGGQVSEGVIVETEGYVGPHDPASHAAARIGMTRRNSAMFGSPGQAYVYRSYGIHWCLNVVTEEVGFPAAVLLRALDPLSGVEVMERRRGGRMPLCSGPGRLGQAMGIQGDLNGHRFTDEPMTISAGWRVPETEVGVSGRIGIRHAAEWPLRFFVRRHPEVSGSGARSLEEPPMAGPAPKAL
ncbi:MAG: DNA-3-methyladenine glycosylase [Gemmatimonadetes bacterium]|nr:DNA-3-methyladenine glycosylase [Gemmatimonadota bacterium]